MYCESKIEHISYAEVEHIKPKKKYPELEFTWDNLGYSCRVCNNKKGQKYKEQAEQDKEYSAAVKSVLVAKGFLQKK